MAITKFYKVVRPRGKDSEIYTNQSLYGSGGVYGRSSWYNRMVNGSASRRNQYREYDAMDNDSDIALALDYIAEEMTGNNPKEKDSLNIEVTPHPNQDISSTHTMTLRAALQTFIKVQGLENNRLFNICRSTIKYGDLFFVRSRKKNGRWIYAHPKNVEGAIVAKDDVTDVKAWQIKTEAEADANSSLGTSYVNPYSGEESNMAQPFLAKDVVRFTLFDETSEEAPFGLSILRPIYKSFKQKELLEDSIVIYRIQRAPERRVFYIDVGREHPHNVSQILEKVKNDFRQKRIPTTHGRGSKGGQSQVDAVYNPQSMQEDFFLAVRPNATGSRIETLPGGQNLGNLDDLHIFFRKIWRGLKIPESYINTLEGDGGSGTFNDGKVGIALMQEVKFSLYIERLQSFIEKTIDEEFKRFIYENGINIDPTIYKITLPAPSNFKKSRDQEIDAALINTYTAVKDDNNLSKRFALKKYLQLTEEEMRENERMLREEKGLPINGGREDIPKLYNPEEAEAGGFEGGLGGVPSMGGGGGEAGGLEGMDEEGEEGLGGLEGEGEETPETTEDDNTGEEGTEETEDNTPPTTNQNKR